MSYYRVAFVIENRRVGWVQTESGPTLVTRRESSTKWDNPEEPRRIASLQSLYEKWEVVEFELVEREIRPRKERLTKEEIEFLHNGQKLLAVKSVRDRTGMMLLEAKKFVESFGIFSNYKPVGNQPD